MDGFQFGRQAFLQIVEELSNGAYFDPQKMRQAHVVHVEQANQTRTGPLIIQTGFHQHEVRFNSIVKVVIGRLGVVQPMVDDGITGRSFRQEEVIPVGVERG